MGEGDDAHEFDALLGELYTPVAAGGTAFCGVTNEQFAINGVTHQWPRGSALKWYAGFDDLGAIRSADVKSCFAEALKEISGCCDVSHTMVSSQLNANLLIVIQRLDGQSGVLGDCEIPVGNPRADSTQLRMRLDTGERWGLAENPTGDLIDLYRVFLHEALHFHGLGHKPASIRDPALIAPMYSPAIRHLQPADKAELVRRYGPAKVVVPTPTPGAPRAVQGSIEVDIDGVKWRAAGPLKRV